MGMVVALVVAVQPSDVPVQRKTTNAIVGTAMQHVHLLAKAMVRTSVMMTLMSVVIVGGVNADRASADRMSADEMKVDARVSGVNVVSAWHHAGLAQVETMIDAMAMGGIAVEEMVTDKIAVGATVVGLASGGLGQDGLGAVLAVGMMNDAL